MRKALSILCCISFAIAGGFMAITANDLSPGKHQAINAATRNVYLPSVPIDTFGVLNLSEDLVRDFAKKKGVADTVYITKTDTITQQVTKVKWRKVPATTPVMEINVNARIDTVRVPVYYLATQVGNKEGPNNECVPIYEVRKVDELCPNSSVEPSIELDSITGAEL